jgi:hypothetical protein
LQTLEIAEASKGDKEIQREALGIWSSMTDMEKQVGVRSSHG